MLKHFVPPPDDVFFSRHDDEDPRLGDRVAKIYKKGRFQFALLGIPDDRGVANNNGRPGARFAPDAIRRELYKMTVGMGGALDGLRLLDLGNLTPGLTIEEDHDKTAGAVEWALKQGMTPIVLGGGNDYAYATASGLHRIHPEYGVMNVDAHLDVRPMSKGLINSGTPFRRLLDKHLQGERFVVFGAQEARNSPHHYKYVKDKGGRVFSLEALQAEGAPERSFQDALAKLALDAEALVLSFDIDACRMSDAPGASASYGNGFSAREAEAMVAVAARESKVKLFEIYEVNPLLDVDRRTCKLAAALVYRFLRERLSRYQIRSTP